MQVQTVTGTVLEARQYGSSTTVPGATRTEVYLTDQDGRERHLNLVGSVAARKGNRVTAIYVRGKTKREIAIFRNHTVRQQWRWPIDIETWGEHLRQTLAFALLFLIANSIGIILLTGSPEIALSSYTIVGSLIGGWAGALFLGNLKNRRSMALARKELTKYPDD